MFFQSNLNPNPPSLERPPAPTPGIAESASPPPLPPDHAVESVSLPGLSEGKELAHCNTLKMCLGSATQI